MYCVSIFQDKVQDDRNNQYRIVIFEGGFGQPYAEIKGFCSKTFSLEFPVEDAISDHQRLGHINKTDGGFFKYSREVARSIAPMSRADGSIKCDSHFKDLLYSQWHGVFYDLCALLITDLKMDTKTSRFKQGYVLYLKTKLSEDVPVFKPKGFYLGRYGCKN